jgi:uncharacterized protein YlxP (DUF503 family)
MQVVVCAIKVHLAANHSLKGKRQLLQALTTRLRNRFNVSVAEVDTQDLWQIATLGVALVAPDGLHARRSMEQVVRFIEETLRGEGEVVDCQIEHLQGVL